MRVNNPGGELTALIATGEPAAKGAGASRATSFAALHADTLARLSTASKSSSASARPATEAKEETTTRDTGSKSAKPKDETYKPVAGQPYEEIVSGRRNGMFINRSGNERDGEAFVLVKRNGREFHVYGTGADRQVVPIAKSEESSSTSVTGGEQVVKGTTYRDVAGRAFDEIVSGPRNGMFINRSGNSRDGQAFVLVTRDDHELHIYGKGGDRLVVRVVPPERRKADPDAPTISAPEAEAPQKTTPATGIPNSGSSVLIS